MIAHRNLHNLGAHALIFNYLVAEEENEGLRRLVQKRQVFLENLEDEWIKKNMHYQRLINDREALEFDINQLSVLSDKYEKATAFILQELEPEFEMVGRT